MGEVREDYKRIMRVGWKDERLASLFTKKSRYKKVIGSLKIYVELD